MIHPKALFLIHHQQAQLLEAGVLAEQLVGSHHHVHGARFQPGQDGFALGRRTKAVEQGHFQGIGGKAFGEGAPMLLGEHRGGGKHRHLFACRDGLEHGADRHLCFAKAHIATHQPVHGLVPFHVALHLDDGLELVGGGFVGEGVFQLVLPGSVGGESKARRLVPLGIELDQVHRHPADGLLGPFFGLGPGRAPHPIELGRGIGGGPEAPQAAQLVGRYPQQTIGVLHHQVVTRFPADGQLFEFEEFAHTVVAVHHKIPGLHFVGIHRAAGGLAAAPHVARGGQGVLAEKFPIRNQHQLPGW